MKDNIGLELRVMLIVQEKKGTTYQEELEHPYMDIRLITPRTLKLTYGLRKFNITDITSDLNGRGQFREDWSVDIKKP